MVDNPQSHYTPAKKPFFPFEYRVLGLFILPFYPTTALAKSNDNKEQSNKQIS